MDRNLELKDGQSYVDWYNCNRLAVVRSYWFGAAGWTAAIAKALRTANDALRCHRARVAHDLAVSCTPPGAFR